MRASVINDGCRSALEEVVNSLLERQMFLPEKKFTGHLSNRNAVLFLGLHIFHREILRSRVMVGNSEDREP